LRHGEYNDHPRNLCRPIVVALVGETPPAAYADRLAFVAERRIALWDVCGMAQRIASADSTMAGEVPNTIHQLLDAHPGIGAVAFNGSGARRLYDRHFTRRAGLHSLA